MIQVKTKTEEFKKVWKRKKLSELRIDDGKDYRIGVELIQREYLPKKRKFTGRFVKAMISDITRLDRWVPDVDYRWVIVHLDPETFERGKTSQL